MATLKVIKKKPKTHQSLMNTISYVLRKDKTSELLSYVTGPYMERSITPKLVYKTFIDNKKDFGKDEGRMCLHYIISFHKDEKITEEEVLDFAIEFASNNFPDNYCLVATHKDKGHKHAHIVIDTVDYMNGKKYHDVKSDLQLLKDDIDRMCKKRGLVVTEKGKHFDGSTKNTLNLYERNLYEMARRNTKDSFVLNLLSLFQTGINTANSKEEFKAFIEDNGCNIIWDDKHKYITLIDNEGHKIRNKRIAQLFGLSPDDLSKEALENFFEMKYQEQFDVEAEQYAFKTEIECNNDSFNEQSM